MEEQLSSAVVILCCCCSIKHLLMPALRDTVVDKKVLPNQHSGIYVLLDNISRVAIVKWHHDICIIMKETVLKMPFFFKNFQIARVIPVLSASPSWRFEHNLIQSSDWLKCIFCTKIQRLRLRSCSIGDYALDIHKIPYTESYRRLSICAWWAFCYISSVCVFLESYVPHSD